MQAAFAFNSLIVLVVIPVSIVYVTDAEWKKKYIPFAYRVNKIEIVQHDFPALIAAKRIEMEEAKKLHAANEAALLQSLSPAEIKLRRKAALRKIEYGPEEQ